MIMNSKDHIGKGSVSIYFNKQHQDPQKHLRPRHSKRLNKFVLNRENTKHLVNRTKIKRRKKTRDECSTSVQINLSLAESKASAEAEY